MSPRKLPWLEVLITVVVVIGCWWVYTNKMEWRDVTTNTGPSKLARENELLASTRLLEEFGYDTERVKEIRFFNDLDSYPDDVIWLYQADALVEDPPFAELEAWTANGGHLIVGLTDPISDGLDEMLERFDIQAFTDPDFVGVSDRWEALYESNKRDDPESDRDYTQPPHPDTFDSHSAPRYTRTRVTRQTNHSDPQAMTIELLGRAEIYPDVPVIDGVRWSRTSGENDAFINVQIRYEKGIVTVLGDATMFSNDNLKNSDNSAYLLELLSVAPSTTVHYFMEERSTPGLLDTLWRLFPATISLFGAALLAWVLYASSRLGPIRTESVRGRTNLISHLRARGHFWRRRGDLMPMTEPVRQAALREIKRQHPQLSKTLDSRTPDALPSDLMIKLSQDIGCPVNHVQNALSAEPLSVRDLPDAAFVLQHILHSSVSRSSGANKASS